MFTFDHPLAPLTTFRIPANAKIFTEVRSVADLQRLIHTNIFATTTSTLIMGGGSNMLFTQDFDGLVIYNKIFGVSFQEESEQSVLVTAGSGENWHHLVQQAVEHQLGGIENLSLIPGTVGASPVQNIGAYGVELKDVFVSLEAFDLATGNVVTFTKEQCRFGYRDSLFKQEGKGKYFITSVTLRLKKAAFYALNTSYGAIAHTLQEMEIALPTIADVSNAVVHIRKSKLPDPAVIGNAGSFFKNPEIPTSDCERLLEENPLMPTYPAQQPDRKKVAAGWLIEQCGWKGKSLGHAAVHPLQALVLTNPGQATGAEVKKLAETIQDAVFQKFGIRLETEVNII